MVRRAFNPGGLVGVWAEENTRASIFAALKRREVYATSGPRIRARLSASAQPLSCDGDIEGLVPMGGEISKLDTAPHFLVQAQFDRVPIQSIEIIKGEIVSGQPRETVTQIWNEQNGGLEVCMSWEDPNFQPESPAFWYVRVLQAPTPRWSAHHCQRAGRCDEYPDANVTVRERAWTSPVWYLPELSMRYLCLFCLIVTTQSFARIADDQLKEIESALVAEYVQENETSQIVEYTRYYREVTRSSQYVSSTPANLPRRTGYCLSS
ncbi:MAG: DUF3604 domain-containing protein [Pseudomonadales bacterium]|nr:DUF3604 domain-containing protein [Pseudomonadales bacterium]